MSGRSLGLSAHFQPVQKKSLLFEKMAFGV